VGAWRNWSGSVVSAPRELACPPDEAALQSLVARTAARGGHLRAVGAGHSSNELVRSDDVLVQTTALAGIVSVDAGGQRATVRAGTRLDVLGCALYRHDLALPNYGDVATQTIGGAIGTGTHGTGATQRNLSSMLVGARVVRADGSVGSIGETDGELPALRVSLGTLGILTEVTLQLVPTFDVERREYASGTDVTLEALPALISGNRSFDFYWYPRRDEAKLRLVNPFGGGSAPPGGARLLVRDAGRGHSLIPTHSGIPHRFEECEYALPSAAGPACFQAVRERVLARWRHLVGWRVLYRTVAADDAWLSPAFGRDTATISLHQNASLPWREYFDDMEPIFREHGGRPHWAKKHGMRAGGLSRLYPRWDEFRGLRRRHDPGDVFLPSVLRPLLEEA
jgi:FAD/FMN-containing dehydrogenase